ncbi:Rho GAP domain-containing protein [Ophiocordyceps camponoti-floridani]|uniref:Rho GAP domain-containing protein n=1 Tax=Ophiocordyceps camponoti-floridani TaxID=2030778 RepID=A0A8H4Q3B8_9HYPO|nr:Rho GAP domain-containing protein [Ophiocordyceps camponoti-floridani]
MESQSPVDRELDVEVMAPPEKGDALHDGRISAQIASFMTTSSGMETLIQHLLQERIFQRQQILQLRNQVDDQRAMIVALRRSSEQAAQDTALCRQQFDDLIADLTASLNRRSLEEVGSNLRKSSKPPPLDIRPSSAQRNRREALRSSQGQGAPSEKQSTETTPIGDTTTPAPSLQAVEHLKHRETSSPSPKNDILQPQPSLSSQARDLKAILEDSNTEASPGDESHGARHGNNTNEQQQKVASATDTESAGGSYEAINNNNLQDSPFEFQFQKVPDLPPVHVISSTPGYLQPEPQPTPQAEQTRASTLRKDRKKDRVRDYLRSPLTGKEADSSSETKQTPLKLFGAPLEEAARNFRAADSDIRLPSVVYRCLEYLVSHDAAQEQGIFRVSGSLTAVRRLRELFEEKGDVELSGEQIDVAFDVHTVASLLKLYLRELPDPILTKDQTQTLLGLTEMSNSGDKMAMLSQTSKRLPKTTFSLLKHIMSLLIRIINRSETNKMNIRNISIVFLPTLNLPAQVLALFLQSYEVIFGVEAEKCQLSAPEVRRRQRLGDSPRPSRGPRSSSPHPGRLSQLVAAFADGHGHDGELFGRYV